MPDALSIIGPHTEHKLYGEILIRVVPLQPPEITGIEPEPMYGVLASAIHVDPGWISLWTVADEDPPIADLEDPEARDRVQRLSILIGATWRACEVNLAATIEKQESAVLRLPPAIYDFDLAELRRVRSAMNTLDQHQVALMLGMTYHWQTDPGGTYGPSHFA